MCEGGPEIYYNYRQLSDGHMQHVSTLVAKKAAPFLVAGGEDD